MGNCLYKRKENDIDNIILHSDNYIYLDIRKQKVKLHETQFHHNNVSFYIYSFTKNNVYERFTLKTKWNYLYRTEKINNTLVYFDIYGNTIIHYEKKKNII